MGDEYGGDFGFLLYALELLPGLEAEPRVKVGKRLVEEQHPRHLNEGTGDGDALLLSAR